MGPGSTQLHCLPFIQFFFFLIVGETWLFSQMLRSRYGFNSSIAIELRGIMLVRFSSEVFKVHALSLELTLSEGGILGI